jgi:ABC-type dipeptide/oligopeptide/nickel transport system permease component
VARYLVRRVAVSVIQLFGLALGVFILIHAAPGNPVREMLGGHATDSEVAQVSARLGLDRPLPNEFFSFVANTVTGHFGQSFTFAQPVGSLISQRIEPSAFLIIYGLLVAVILGVPMAIVAALHVDGVMDNVIRTFSTIAFTMPGFWLGLVLALVFALKLNLLPVSGYAAGFGGNLRSLTLPAIALGLSLLAVVVRTLRASMRKVLSTEYIEAATARGLTTRRIVAKHVMRNAIMPTITVLAVNVGFLIGGTVVLEQVFEIPGLGSLLFQAVERRDYPIVETLSVLAGAVVVILGLLADVTQAFVDPRVRLGNRRD